MGGTASWKHHSPSRRETAHDILNGSNEVSDGVFLSRRTSTGTAACPRGCGLSYAACQGRVADPSGLTLSQELAGQQRGPSNAAAKVGRMCDEAAGSVSREPCVTEKLHINVGLGGSWCRTCLKGGSRSQPDPRTLFSTSPLRVWRATRCGVSRARDHRLWSRVGHAHHLPGMQVSAVSYIPTARADSTDCE